MSKSILVIDAPEKCDGCILHGTMIGRQVCIAEIKRVKDENSKPDWCPLRDLPKYKDLKVEAGKDIAIGWNRCLSEILKGGEAE